MLLWGCVPIQDHNLSPSNDALWIPAGAAVDLSLQAVKTPPIARFAVDGATAATVRLTNVFKHPQDSGFDMLFGAMASTLVGCIWRGAHHKGCLR